MAMDMKGGMDHYSAAEGRDKVLFLPWLVISARPQIHSLLFRAKSLSNG